MRSLILGLLAVVASGGCSSSPAPQPMKPLLIADGCQPLAPDASCTLPYPSDFFFDGKSVKLTGAAKVVTQDGKDCDLTEGWPADGASRQPAIMGVLPSEIVGTGLPNILDDPSASTQVTSPTLLLRADTGEAVPHYVDVDPRPDDPAKVVVQIRPLVQLAEKTRYIVVFKGIRTMGGIAQPAEGFRRLRDKQTSLDPALAALAPRFEERVFAPLAQKGVARKDLQLAWDFTTASAQHPIDEILQVRELTLAWLKSNTPVVTVSGTTSKDPYWREIRGTIQGPLFLDKPDVGGKIFHDASGKVAQNGTATWPFVAIVPNTVRDQFDPGRTVLFGHGFFGDQSEADGVEARDLLSTLHATTFAIDWWGMATPDRDQVVATITSQPARTVDFVERVHQAMANWLVTSAAVKGPIKDLPDFKRPMSGPGTSTNGQGMSNAGALLYDPAHVYYFGASNGHILGSTMSALNPDVERAVLNVGGAGWEHMIPRALPFVSLQFILLATIRDRLPYYATVALLAQPMDRIDPANYAQFLIGSKLPGNPDRKVLLQTGIGDASVPNIAGFNQARLLGLSHVGPPPYPLWNIPTADAATLTSGYLTIDYGIAPSVYRDPVPPSDNQVHSSVRHDPVAMAQMDAFLKPNGVIIQPCNGAPCKGKLQ